MNDTELITVTVSTETRRRLATVGFPHELGFSDVARFLIEQGLNILETRDNPRTPKAASCHRSAARRLFYS